jgi:hypothetical protein
MSDLGNASSISPLLNVLLPVIVGGAIGIIGGLVGPYFIQRAKEKADKKRTRIEKFEELLAAVAEHYYWIAATRYFFISGQGSEPTLSPMPKIQAITATYFPEFQALVRQLDSTSNEYEVWMLNIGQKRLRNEPGYERLVGAAEVMTKYTNARMAFLAELRRFARREFQ